MSDFNSRNNRADWFDIPVKDLDRAKSFYEAVLDIKVFKEKFDNYEFCVLDHENGNGGCLVPNENDIASNSGILLYLNVDGRIRDAMNKAEEKGAKVLEPLHGIGPHGFRSIILDSEGNRIVLHSNSDS